MPPLAPPSGRSATAFFRVMMAASTSHSWVFNPVFRRTPPMLGPSAMLWTLR